MFNGVYCNHYPCDYQDQILLASLKIALDKNIQKL